VEVAAVDDASSVGMIEGAAAASTMGQFMDCRTYRRSELGEAEHPRVRQLSHRGHLGSPSATSPTIFLILIYQIAIRVLIRISLLWQQFPLSCACRNLVNVSDRAAYPQTMELLMLFGSFSLKRPCRAFAIKCANCA